MVYVGNNVKFFHKNKKSKYGIIWYIWGYFPFPEFTSFNISQRVLTYCTPKTFKPINPNTPKP
jgi:hypothetical protein